MERSERQPIEGRNGHRVGPLRQQGGRVARVIPGSPSPNRSPTVVVDGCDPAGRRLAAEETGIAPTRVPEPRPVFTSRVPALDALAREPRFLER